jgi:hypothetical protein
VLESVTEEGDFIEGHSLKHALKKVVHFAEKMFLLGGG